MINIEKTKKYCRENIAAIENYEKALNDETQTWEIHHRLEVQEDGTLISRDELIERDLYWGRPACELIFLTKSDHNKLHKIGNTNMLGKKMSEDAKQKLREAHIGKHHSKETKQKMSEAHKGNTNWLGKKHSDETRQKMKEAFKGKTWIIGNDGKRHWIEKNSSIALF